MSLHGPKGDPLPGWLTNIQRFSTHDGPGIRSTLFFQGCSLKCRWCQNPETIPHQPVVLYRVERCIGCGHCRDICPKECFTEEKAFFFDSTRCDRCGLCINQCKSKALQWSSNVYSVSQVIDIVMGDKDYFEHSGGGVTFSGGEPLCQPHFCAAVASGLKAQGVHVALDTAGNVDPDIFESVLPIFDLILFDLKLMDPQGHRCHTGEDNRRVVANFKRAARWPGHLIVRTPMIPSLTDTIENSRAIENFVFRYSPETVIETVSFNRLAEEKYRMIGKRFPIVDSHLCTD